MPRHNQGHYLSDEPNEHGFFEIRWTENGRSKRKSTGATDRRRAQRVYAEFILALEGAHDSVAITAGQVIDAYVKDRADVVDRDSQANTFGHLKAHFGHLAVTEIEDDDVKEYGRLRAAGQITFTDETGRVRGGWAAGDPTVRRELGMFSTAIGYCIDKRKFRATNGEALLKAVHKPHIELPPPPQPRDRWLSREEATALLAACQEDAAGPLTRVYRYTAMMLYTAARKEVVHTLTWDRIVLVHDEERHAAGDYGMINFQAPGRKVTKKRRGWVPVSAEFYPILAQAEREATTPHYCDTPVEPYHQFRAAARRAGLVDAGGALTVSPHVLRHTWATWAARDGVPLYEIAGALHDTMATVERTYAHHAPEHLRKAFNRPMLAVVGGSNVRAA